MPCPLPRAAGKQCDLRHTQSLLYSHQAPCSCWHRRPQLSVRRAGPLSAAPAASRHASGREGHKTHVTTQQRHGVSSEAAHHGQQHQHSHSHHAAGSASDDSVRIVMLLSLSLTLMLLPWMSRHPEFLIAPLLLAITPVVGNGVRPVLKEVGSGLLTTLKLSLGLITHHDQHQQLSGGHHHNHGHHHGHHNHQQHHGHSSHRQQQQQHQQQQANAYNQYVQQQQQHQPPAGPYSPWPNPERMPTAWPPAAAAAAGVTPGPGEADNDWAPNSRPDPHQADPHSQQHLQQLLAADMQVEQDLGRPAAAGHSSSPGRGSPSTRSPAASPTSSVDGLSAAAPDLLQGLAAAGQQQQQHAHGHQHLRDPRVLSRKAKQQLYHNHSHHGAGGQQQQQQQQQR
ncbi:hypothetical protein COO60DRAFT_1701884 [Scenedesmus sp. NREL 46B-D3]|nr:hypothetical protein COO60DRAFT_1701884 [Scenedesmus sp. NREL 46B-D3]